MKLITIKHLEMDIEAKNYKLTYFSSRGIAEPIRLLLHYKGIPFEEVLFKSFVEDPTREEWLKHKQNYLYGQLPNLEWDEGSKHKVLAQSHTICRYLANRYGLAGSDFWEAAKADEIAEWFKDIWPAFLPFLVVAVNGEVGEKEKEAKKKELFVPLINDRLVPTLTKMLHNSGSGFLLPSGITWPDFVIANALTTFNNMDNGKLFESHKALADYEKGVYSANELVAKYVKERTAKQF